MELQRILRDERFTALGTIEDLSAIRKMCQFHVVLITAFFVEFLAAALATVVDGFGQSFSLRWNLLGLFS